MERKATDGILKGRAISDEHEVEMRKEIESEIALQISWEAEIQIEVLDDATLEIELEKL